MEKDPAVAAAAVLDPASKSSQNGATVVRQKKPGLSPKQRLNQIYALPLPLTCHPLPAFIPHNPLSVLRIAYAILSTYFTSQSSHPSPRYKGVFSADTQSVHVTDPALIRALWEKGFFGKGTLSRSDPSWLDREKRRRGLAAQKTSEEFTMKRREERRMMKYERALKEREAIENQLRQEGKILDLADGDGKATAYPDGLDATTPTSSTPAVPDVTPSVDGPFLPLTAADRGDLDKTLDTPVDIPSNAAVTPDEELPENIEDQEHLQLAPEEAFFLSYGLGVLDVYDEDSETPFSTHDLFEKLRSITYSPRAPSPLQPDDPFLLRYVVYHHFRSLGWVPRGGSKFSVDFLLYNRGPVFSHAEFAVLILPSYSHPYWGEPSRKAEIEKKEKREWYWLHCINRVQAHVHKTLVLVYVDIPPPSDKVFQEAGNASVGRILQKYKVREFVLRRWLLNRSRD